MHLVVVVVDDDDDYFFLVTIYESCSFWLRAHFEHLLFQAKKVKVKLTVEDAKVRAHTVKEMKHIEKVLHERNLS